MDDESRRKLVKSAEHDPDAMRSLAVGMPSTMIPVVFASPVQICVKEWATAPMSYALDTTVYVKVGDSGWLLLGSYDQSDDVRAIVLHRPSSRFGRVPLSCLRVPDWFG